MQSRRGSLTGRARWIIAFALLLLATTAVPVLADSPSESSEGSPSSAEVPAPSASELAAVEDEQRERTEWLSSPEAQKQREASQGAYTNLTAGEAQSLLVEAFPGQLKALNGDPARVLSELEIEKPLGTYAARVEAGEGESAILDSSVPVQSEIGGEGKAPVDLTLERSGSSFVPRNPITEVKLPTSAEEPIQLQSGIEVELPASDDHGAEPIGAMNLFYPETETATDTLVAPRAGGVEVFEQLRSSESPERFSFALNLPKDTTLRQSESGGAEIVSSSGKEIEEVPPPSATDAQGATVPVTTSIEGDSLILEVPHRSPEVAYPVLLDPEYVTDTTSFGEWGASLNSGYEYYLNNNWSSLDAISRGHYYYPAYTHGQWAWGAYGSTGYIAAATFSPVDYIVHSCYTYEPHGYIGLYNPGSGNYDALGIWATWNSEGGYETGWKGNTGTRDAIIGIGTSGAGVEIGCAHELYVGGYSIQEKDPEAPTVNSVTGIPGGWAKEFTVTPHVSDPGLGVKAITLSPEGGSPHTNSQGCTGANGSRCPGSWETSFDVSYFLEGERSASITAYDPLGPDVGSHVSSSYTWTTRLDRQKPEVELEGEFTEAIEEAEEEGEGKKAPALHLPVYNLKIKATDKANEGNPKTEAKARRSGVENIAVFLDGKEMTVPWEAQPCSGPEYSCSMEETYPVPLNEVQGGGVHHLKVIATDQLGNEREEEKEFEYFPATGMKDEYVMQHFPLPNGEGNESEEENPVRPELAVNVTNGNLVYRQKDVEVTGPAVDLEVERFYNSQLPEEDNTQWGDGWTLAQTPKLELEETKEEAPPAKASMVRTSGVLESTVGLPTESGAAQFDKKLQAVVTKEPGGGYEVEDQSGETDTSLAFDEAGKVQELQTPGYAKIDYSYEEGELSEIAVEDPASTDMTPEEVAEFEELAQITPTYKSSFGSSGTGNGQFQMSADVALDAKENLWVVDEENNRVQEFDSKGQYLTKFGTEGTGNGQFEYPHALAIDAKGNLWVTDIFNGRVQEFNSKGEYLSQFGSPGTGNGQFEYPEGIAIDAKGNVWVADTGNDRLQEFNEKGEFIKVVGSSGTGNGQFGQPGDIAIDPQGNLWVADFANSRVQELNEAGEYLSQFGSHGTGNGQFEYPDGIAIDAKGGIFVADTWHGRVEEFNEAGEYLTQFGSEGSGEGQFDTPLGIAADPKGHLWIADANNNRVQKWRSPSSTPTYSSSFGAEGSGNGQFKHPADVARDEGGNLWLVDKENNRIEEFDGAGKFLQAFGAKGSANGQLNGPSALAIDPEGHIWVADRGNHRVQEFGKEGEYLSQFGTSGGGNGQFVAPEGIAIDAKGNIWVSDASILTNRVQEFNSKGEFIKVVASNGTGPGQTKAPSGLAIDPQGNLWVADRNNLRVQEFNEAGEYVRQFQGSGEAAFKPFAIDVDADGAVWVGDIEHNRVERFNEDGYLLAEFGSEGSGEGQFKLSAPIGLQADSSGNVWIADAGNNRVQTWLAPEHPEADQAPAKDDPTLEVNTSSGLVSSVEGEEAGTTTYSHEGEMLSAVDGPKGETEYEYDSEERLTNVTLPNGTWGEIKYDSFSRVESVTVSVEGAKAKTTKFTYKDEPRRTTVSAEGEPATIYDIAPDGSVLKWWNTEVPPEIENLSGSLYANKETSEAIEPGDYELLVQAFAAEGIASIQIIANGNQLVDEKTCEKTAETNCKTVEDPWVTNTGNWPPGILQLEVIVTSSLEGSQTVPNTESAKFWVNIPYTPPPDPEAEEPPTFEEVLHFREEFGLDLDLKGNEIAIDERIFNLIGDWNNPHTPTGEVARATMETWGVPLRAVDAAELEYRDWYLTVDGPLIENWGYSNYPSTYAGYEMDNAAGGILRVGFTQDQATRVEELKQQGEVVAPDRLGTFINAPTQARTSLEAREAEIDNAVNSDPQLGSLVSEVGISEGANTIRVGATNAASAEQRLSELFGSLSGITVAQISEEPEAQTGRDRQTGPMFAGDRVWTDWEPHSQTPLFTWGTAGFGAYENVYKSAQEQWVKAKFLLAAGHMGAVGTVMYRIANSQESPAQKRKNGQIIGTVQRNPHFEGPVNIDALAMPFSVTGIAPSRIFGENGKRLPVKKEAVAHLGQTLCVSGSRTERVKHGEVIRIGPIKFKGEAKSHGVLVVNGLATRGGDSGSPVWNCHTHAAIGILSGGHEVGTISYVQPLLRTPTGKSGTIPGALESPLMGKLHVIRSK